MLAVALSACAFSSAHPFFGDNEAVALFGNGQTLSWRESSEGEVFNVQLVPSGKGYILNRIDEPDEHPMHATLIPIADTPEDDYVAQVRINNEPDDVTTAYGFVWREGGGYRVFADPVGFDGDRQAPPSAERFCQAQGQGECEFATRADLLGYYRQIIYPQFVQQHRTPSSYIDLGPPLAETPPHQ